MNEKKTYEPAGIKVVELDRDLLIQSRGILAEDGWEEFDFGNL